jgi:hypothetical protein
MANARRENSVRSLVNLYTVVIGVALSLAVLGVVDEKNGLQHATFSSFLLFIAFVATLFPFFHGALRHLDDAYLENKNPHIKDGALVVDFVLLFIHALAFVVLALLLKKPGQFAWVLVGLIAIDVVWGVFVIFGSSSKGEDRAETKWTVINVVFASVAIIYLVLHDIDLNEVANPVKVAIPVALACVVRSVVDYAWCKNFYFPK